MSQLNGDSVAMVAEVLVVGRSDVGWLCEVDGNRVFLATSQIPPGFQMPEVGERGAIQIATVAAQVLKLSHVPPWPNGKPVWDDAG